jgi:Holliday junction resolvasome RuvABC DNA-binding subunit
MSSTNNLQKAYEAAVVSVLNTIPGVEPDQAEQMVEAIVDLVLATFEHEMNQELQNESTCNH